MITAIIILSITVLLLLLTIVICALKIVDTNATLNCVTAALRNKEEISHRQRNLVYTKFNYHLPESDKYLSLEELKLEKGL